MAAAEDDVEPETAPEQERELDRVAAFSDGVFSIAATLLVLSIDIPQLHRNLDAHDWNDVIQPIFTYFLSFAVVGVFWLNHHRLLGRMRSSTHGFALRSLVFLAFVALLPAPTELLGAYESSTGSIIFYASNVLVLSLLSRELSRYADAERLTTRPGQRSSGVLARWGVVIGFGLSIPVAVVDPGIAPYIWLLAPILVRLSSRLRPSHSET